MSNIETYTASWLYNPGSPPVSGGAVAVMDGLVVASGRASEVISSFGPPKAEYHGCAIIPGFANAHTHLELTHFPAWRTRNGLDYHPHRFVDWIIQMIKVRRGITVEELRTSLKAGISVSLRAGTTLVGDIVTSPELLSAYDETEIGGRFYLELTGQERLVFEPRLSKAVAAARGIAGNLLPGLSPHAPYTLNSELLTDIAAAAEIEGLPIALHLAESRGESDLLFDSSGPLATELYQFVGWDNFLPSPRKTTPARFFDDGGLLGPSTIAVHCVHTNPSDAALLKERGVTVCLCPRSNERLDVGTAPVSLFKKHGIPLCLGTDSLASNDSLSIWDEIRYALDIYNGELTPEELLEMATLGGAAAIGLEKQAGSLTPGKRADFQVVEIEGKAGDSSTALPELLLDAGSRLREVFTSGKSTCSPSGVTLFNY